jgi:hypothetical protein
MLDTDTGELEEKTLEHEGDTVREFYSALPGPILVGIEATGSMQWFLEMMEELGIECRVGRELHEHRELESARHHAAPPAAELYITPFVTTNGTRKIRKKRGEDRGYTGGDTSF